MAVKTISAFVSGIGAATDTAVVAAVPGRKIRVMGGYVSAGAAASTITFTSKPAGSGVACAGVINLPINGSLSLDSVVVQTNLGEGLSVTTAQAGPASVHVAYELVS
jgi:hypothetical protein